MIFNVSKNIKFSFFYRKLNILSTVLMFLSVLIILFKGLNLGVDFKGGTLIEMRTENSQISISEIRESFLKMKLGDVNIHINSKNYNFVEMSHHIILLSIVDIFVQKLS